ncbi:MAG: hypothetical protein H6Q67_1670 [Firmicutes bacterium]|nr:hypothetical protein [Bacillota bacterium]
MLKKAVVVGLHHLTVEKIYLYDDKLNMRCLNWALAWKW